MGKLYSRAILSVRNKGGYLYLARARSEFVRGWSIECLAIRGFWKERRKAEVDVILGVPPHFPRRGSFPQSRPQLVPIVVYHHACLVYPFTEE
jgi:hypothetical protein